LRLPHWLIWLGIPLILLAGIVLLWDWDWFIPIVDARASAALGRKVTIAHLHVRLGRTVRIVADDVQIANPPDFPGTDPLARIAHLTVRADLMEYLRHRTTVLPLVALDHPVIEAEALADGRNNYTLSTAGPGGGSSGSGSSMKIGDLRITDGRGHVVIPKLKADFNLQIATREAPAGSPADRSQLLVEARGTYAAQPITGQFVGGAVLSLRDASHPYPVDLRIQNGPTHVRLVGTVQRPLAFEGADLKLTLTGPNMALLLPLTGIPIPKTPAYRVTGQLDYADKRIRFRDFAGEVGNSDLEGTIAVDPGPGGPEAKPDVTMDLSSRRVDLADLGGFIGSEPGRLDERNETPQQREAVARAEASPRLIPNTPINLPRLRAANVHLRYRGARIEGRSVPLDNLVLTMDIVNGSVSLHPISFGVGTGQIGGNISLVPNGDLIHTKADIDFRQINLARLFAALHVFHGNGIVGGKAEIDGTGNSLAAMLSNGNGGLDLYMSGGNLSAVLVDLSGLEFGNALLSALGLPKNATIDCFIGQFALQRGVISTRTLLLDTNEAVVRGSGDVDLRAEKVDYRLKTDAKHFSIGSLPAPIVIEGTLKKPSIHPDAAALGIRGGVAAGLGILAAPLALLPTIQLGLGEGNQCAAVLSRPATHAPAAPAPVRRQTRQPARRR
jgi:uncharacterized protein involved in outer membrane biogenesis